MIVIMQQGIKTPVGDWIEKNNVKIDNIKLDFFSNRDVFQEELMKMTQDFLQEKVLSEKNIYIISAMIGEIGNNSFDHNMGNWPDVRGIVFGYNFDGKVLQVVIADNGQGILKTLRNVMPDLENDKQALKVAFTEIVSGRAPEARGNGLKFVRENIVNSGMQLMFVSGNAKVMLNGGLEIDNINEEYKGCLAILNF